MSLTKFEYNFSNGPVTNPSNDFTKKIFTKSIAVTTQTDPKEVDSKCTQTFVQKQYFDSGDETHSISTVTTVSDRSSNVEEFILESESSDDSDLTELCMRKNTIMIMKARPKHYMGIDKKCIHLIRVLMRKTHLSEVQIMLTLRKIRLNEEFQTLADLFDVHRQTAGQYFHDSIGPIAKCLKKFMKYAKPKTIKRNLPISFRRNLDGIGAILDCFEIQIERPSKPKKQAKSWSPYKSCNTVKYLVCVTPDGLIYYVSCGYGGRSSDLIITTSCKLHKSLKSKYIVMADRGFKGIENFLIKKGSKLFRPPSATSSQMSKRDVKLTKQIASLRIHVERSIGRIRDFNMCKPHVTLDAKLVKHINIVVKIACGLANLQHLLIKT
ncbi:hypothetical protein HA402_005970 [Bradysia odoriphaga]|nr:hypothetical protein HA402_005970 [Bradysia odoriphaga]